MIRRTPTLRDGRIDATGFGGGVVPFNWETISNIVSRYSAESSSDSRTRAAADFSGSNYLQRVDGTEFDHSGSVSVWCWFQRSEVGATGRVLLGKWGANGEYVLELNTDNSKAQFRVHDGTGEVIAIASTLVNVGSKFWFVCGTANASEVKVYVGDENGGSLVTATATPAAGVRNTADNFFVGTKNAGTWNYQGEMDFPMLAHDKLSDTQVDYIYNAGAGRTYTDLADEASASVVAKGDIIAAWPFGEDSAERADVSGTGAHLSDVGTVVRGDGFLEEQPASDFNYAGRFLRSDPGYYEAASVPALAGTGTVATWIRFTGSTADYTIWGFSESGVVDNYIALQYQGASDTLKLLMEDNGGGAETADKASVGITAGQWHHVALVANGDTNGYNIYLDGVDVGALSGLDTGKWLSVFTGLDRTNIGVQNLTTRTAGFSGDIDEVMYFDSALSASEIEDLAEGDTVGQLATTYPAIHAKLTHAWTLENNYIAEDLIGSLDLTTVDDVNIASPIIKAGADRGKIFKALDIVGSNDLEQATQSERPFYIPSRNGKNAFRFPLSTTTSALRTGTIANIAAPFTGYVVFKPRVVSGGGIRTYVYLENSGSDALGSLVLLDTGVVRWRNKFFEELESAAPVSATVPTICFFNCDSDESGALYVNGGTAVTGTVGAEPIQAICLGGRFNDFSPADGDIYEAAIFTGLVSVADMNLIGNQAAAKFGGTWTDI